MTAGRGRRTIGVVVPVHDSRRTLPRALRSIQRQTHAVDEIVVVDDRSTDGVAALVAGWDDPRVRLVPSAGPGAAAARNTGVAALGTELVAFLDSDDVWYPEKIERQLPLLTDDVILVGCLVHYLGESGEVLGTHVPFDDWGRATASARAGESLPVPTTSLLLRRADLVRSGGFDTTFRQSEDLELVTRLLQDGRRLVWPRGQILAGYVLSTSGVTRQHYREQFLAAELVRARLAGRTTAGYDEWMAAPGLDLTTWRRMHGADRYRRAAVARGNDQRARYVLEGVVAVALDPVGAAVKLRRRGRPSEPVAPAGPPREVLRDIRDSYAGASTVGEADAGGLVTSEVAGLRLVEDPRRIPAAAVRLRQERGDASAVVVHAAHVTALNARDQDGFREAFNSADYAHADGVSWSVLARATGARARKLATTDLVPLLLDELAGSLAASPRVAVVGGEPGVAEAAAAALEELGAQVVHATHGYHEDWEPVLADVRAAQPDLVLVGLGMPLEAFWTHRHRGALPGAVVVTCGGYLRLLAGSEQRAPELLQRVQAEWLYRLVRDPRRTAARYRRGAVELALAVLSTRRRGRP